MTRRAKRQTEIDVDSSQLVKEIREEVIHEGEKRKARTLFYKIRPDGSEEQLGTLRYAIEADVSLSEGELEGQLTKELNFYFRSNEGWTTNLKIPIFADRFRSEEQMYTWLGSISNYISYYLPQRYLETATLVVDEALCFASEAHKIVSIDKAHLVKTHAKLVKQTKKDALRMAEPGRPKGSLVEKSLEDEARDNEEHKVKILSAMYSIYRSEMEKTNNEFHAEDAMTKGNIANKLAVSRVTLNTWLSNGNFDFEELKGAAMAM